MEMAAPERIERVSKRSGSPSLSPVSFSRCADSPPDPFQRVVEQRPVGHGRHGAEELGGEDEALGHPVLVGGHLLESQSLEAQGPLIVGAGSALCMRETRRSGS